MKRSLYKYAAVALCSIVGVGSYFVIPWSGMTKGDWASWVQAIGSIATIAGAYWIGERQFKKTIRSKRESLIAVAEAAKDIALKVDHYFESTNTRMNLLLYCDKSVIELMAATMAQAPAHELGSSLSVKSYLAIQNELTFLSGAVERYKDGPFEDPIIKRMREEQNNKATIISQEVVGMVEVVDQMLAKRVRGHVETICKAFKQLTESQT